GGEGTSASGYASYRAADSTPATSATAFTAFRAVSRPFEPLPTVTVNPRAARVRTTLTGALRSPFGSSALPASLSLATRPGSLLPPMRSVCLTLGEVTGPLSATRLFALSFAQSYSPGECSA
ncbi:MAG: hypothetical protein MK125_06790, partial [Dehalococcoidia bacterium]|nr:hypothetical protein [Dehalococcoidia bacterium]